MATFRLHFLSSQPLPWRWDLGTALIRFYLSTKSLIFASSFLSLWPHHKLCLCVHLLFGQEVCQDMPQFHQEPKLCQRFAPRAWGLEPEASSEATTKTPPTSYLFISFQASSPWCILFFTCSFNRFFLLFELSLLYQLGFLTFLSMARHFLVPWLFRSHSRARCTPLLWRLTACSTSMAPNKGFQDMSPEFLCEGVAASQLYSRGEGLRHPAPPCGSCGWRHYSRPFCLMP